MRGRPPKPIKIHGVEYPTVLDAAKALKVSKHTIYNARHRNSLDTVGYGSGGTGGAFKPVTIRGVRYPSITSAAACLGVHRSAISRARRAGRLDTVGVPRE